MTYTHSIAKMLEIKDKNIILEEKITEKEINDVKSTIFQAMLT